MAKILSMLLLLIVPLGMEAQILPKEGSKLNYRIVGFSFPAEASAKYYTLVIAADHCNSEDSFAKKHLLSLDGSTNKIIAEVPSFGKEYTWRVVYTRTDKKVIKGPLHHFSTGMSPRVDTSKLRLRVMKPAAQYKDAYIGVDAGGVLYDMRGNPVWYLPDSGGYGGYVLDMQFTPYGTVTFMYQKKIYEVDYNGDILWMSSKNDSGVVSGIKFGEMYHHAFTRLSNGHYMALGTELMLCKSAYSGDSSKVIVSKESGTDPSPKDGFKHCRFGTIIEYDKAGNIVWSWKSSAYFLSPASDFPYYRGGTDSNLKFDPHDNAFYFDEKNSVIYLGLRNMNRIMKIEYPSGKVLRTYGEIYKKGVPGTAETGDGLFCNQHSINRTMEGYLYIFNNNSCRNLDSMPAIEVLQEPVSPGDTFKKIWAYTCKVEGNIKKFGSGGNVMELPDGSFFANMGSEYSKLFIVNRAKKELWSALPERLMETDQLWTPIKNYRATVVNRKTLDTLIWNTVK